MEYLHLNRTAHGVMRLQLNRPDLHNAFNEAMIAELTAVFHDIAKDSTIRLVVLAAAGKSFSAGADIDWMRRMAEQDYNSNRQDAEKLAAMFHALDHIPQPVIALVHGAAMGGGVGLVACADIAIAASSAVFSLSEVKLGLIPAVIGPYVLRAIGMRQARRFFLTGERFSAETALAAGLVHHVTAPDALEDSLAHYVNELLSASPAAVASAKSFLHELQGLPISTDIRALSAIRIAERRASADGKEGVAAFLEKRLPDWRK